MTDHSLTTPINCSSKEKASFVPNQTFTIIGDNQHSALELLYLKTSLNKKVIKEAAQKGAIWISRQSPLLKGDTQSTENITHNNNSKPQRLRRLKKTLLKNQVIHFYFNPELLAKTPYEPILIDDMQLYSAWLKPRGMLSQGSKWADHTALYRWVEMNSSELNSENSANRQCWIVHRLDRATCGLMLLAHTKKMASKLTQLFENHAVNKTYRAWVWGKLKTKPQTIKTLIDNKTAVSHLLFLEYHESADATLVEINIETGRKHQIRKHLSSIEHPIIGDRLYGNETLDNQFLSRPDLQLTAFKLEFTCPESGEYKKYRLEDKEMALLNDERFKMEFRE